MSIGATRGNDHLPGKTFRCIGKIASRDFWYNIADKIRAAQFFSFLFLGSACGAKDKRTDLG